MKKIFTLASLLFAGITSYGQIANPSFESSHNYNSVHTLTVPDGWHGSDSLADWGGHYKKSTNAFVGQIALTNNSHTGQAAKIMTKDEDTLGVIPGALSNAQDTMQFAQYQAFINGLIPFQYSISYLRGSHITQHVGTVSAWLKYAPAGIDTAFMLVNVVSSNNTVLGTADTFITANMAAFDSITVHVNYTNTTTTPAYLQIVFSSSGLSGGTAGSILYVDDVSYTILPNDVKNVGNERAYVNFYPNPSAGVVYLYSNVSEKLSWQVYNANGQVVVNNELATNNREDLSNLASGTYFYNILNSKGEIVQKDKFTIAK